MRAQRAVLAIIAMFAVLAGVPGCTSRIEVDGARAHARVVEQVNMGPRIPGSEGHRVFREWLVAELGRLGARVERQALEDSVGGVLQTVTNVIARFGPREGRPILLAAHYDTRAAADRDPERPGDPVPGANDGASGVAVLLEVAELMRLKPPPRGVELVFFDAEDQGRHEYPEEFSRGAQGYARSLESRLADGSAPIAGFLFDMVGDRDLNIHPEVTSARRASNIAALVLEAAAATGARHFHEEPKYPVMDDHVPILDAGVPCVDIIDFDYPAWHTTADTPDQVSPESLAEVARVAAWLVYQSPLARSGPR
jgi:hypothetical protein